MSLSSLYRILVILQLGSSSQPEAWEWHGLPPSSPPFLRHLQLVSSSCAASAIYVLRGSIGSESGSSAEFPCGLRLAMMSRNKSGLLSEISSPTEQQDPSVRVTGRLGGTQIHVLMKKVAGVASTASRRQVLPHFRCTGYRSYSCSRQNPHRWTLFAR